MHYQFPYTNLTASSLYIDWIYIHWANVNWFTSRLTSTDLPRISNRVERASWSLPYNNGGIMMSVCIQ